MSKNLYKLFYKEYFSQVDFSYMFDGNNDSRKRKEKSNQTLLKEKNNDLLNASLFVIPSCKRANAQVPLKVEYPGLITGVGIGHEANIEGEFKLGIHLDYTYGMPIIYGSSVKGILRAAFNDYEYIKGLLRKEVDVEDLIRDIFYGQERDFEKEGSVVVSQKIYKSKSIYKRDIFFDAVIISSDSNNRILTSDYITPHLNPLRDPIPISFVKIASGCTIEFRFRIVDSILPRIEKLALFLKILQDGGIGAKTHVGYGQLSEAY